MSPSDWQYANALIVALALAVVGLGASISKALAGEDAVVPLVCLTETAILSLVDADRKGGYKSVAQAVVPLLQTNQCRAAPREMGYPVTLTDLVFDYKDSEGHNIEIWKTKAGFYTFIAAEKAPSI